MKIKVTVAVVMSMLAFAFATNDVVQAADFASVVIWNNTDRVAMFEVRRGNGRPIAYTDVVGPGGYTTPVGGDPKKFKIKAFVWGETTEQWRAGSYWIPFTNPGGQLAIEYHYTGNGTSLTLSKMAD